MTNHYTLEVANILVRTLRATGATAESTAKQLCIQQYCPESQRYPGEKRLHWEVSVTTKTAGELAKEGLPQKKATKDKIPAIVWAIAKTNMPRNIELSTQESICAAQDTAIREDPKNQHLTFKQE